MTETSRRAILAGAAGVGGAVALSACGGTESGKQPADPDPAPAGGGAGELAKTSDIPVSGGKVFSAEKVVVTQPSAGQFKAFTAVCTHQGCTVASVANGTISCACHGSQFSAADGSVKKGPATQALASKSVTVSGNSIKLA